MQFFNWSSANVAIFIKVKVWKDINNDLREATVAAQQYVEGYKVIPR